MEYPYLSCNGKIIILMNGDQSGIRTVDYNGNLGPIRISGRTCTAVVFSDRGDYGGVGFLDGSYYIIDPRGALTFYGMTPKGTMVKGLAVSGNGSYCAVHYGDTRKDHLRVIEIGSGDHDEVELAHAHPVKTAMHIGGDGYCTIIDIDRVLRVLHRAA